MTIWRKTNNLLDHIDHVYRKGEVNISILLDFYNAQCLIYDTLSFFNFGELWWLIKPILDKWSQLI